MAGAKDSSKLNSAASKAAKVAKLRIVREAEEASKVEKAASVAEKFHSELDVLKQRAREIPRTLTDDEIRACEAVRLQMKGKLPEPGKVSVAEVEKIDDAVKAANAVGESVGVVKTSKVAETLEKIKSAGSTNSVTETKSLIESVSESTNDYIKNWKGKRVRIPDGHIMSPKDPSFSAKPIIEVGPYTSVQRVEFLKGNSAGTKLASHHRHQIPVRDGGVIDEIPGPGHSSGNLHTAGSPSRHPAKSVFNSEPAGNALRAYEIKQHWIDKGKRLIEIEPGIWIDPGV